MALILDFDADASNRSNNHSDVCVEFNLDAFSAGDCKQQGQKCICPSAANPSKAISLVLESIEGSYPVIHKSRVPALVADNPLWRRGLKPMCKTVRRICQSNSLAALLVELKTGEKVVLKAWPARRVKQCADQIEAEKEAAKLFSHPLMATVAAVAKDSAGNVCCVSPYAGSSLDAVISHPLYEVIPVAEKLRLVAKSITSVLMALAHMQAASDGVRLYRDMKPSNIAIDPSTSLGKVFDFGLMMRMTGEDYHDGITLGYYPPEICQPGENGFYDNFCDQDSRKALIAAVGDKWDSYLTAYTFLEALMPLPWQLLPSSYDLSHPNG